MIKPQQLQPQRQFVPTVDWVAEEPRLANARFQLVERRVKTTLLAKQACWTIKVIQSQHPNYHPSCLFTMREEDILIRMVPAAT